MTTSRETLRVVAILLFALGLPACDRKEQAQSAASAPTPATSVPQEVVHEVENRPAPTAETSAAGEVTMSQASPDMMPRQLLAPAQPVTLTIQVFERRAEGGVTRLVEHSRVTVDADATLGCGQQLVLATPLPPSPTHAGESTEPHWAVLDVEIGGVRCRSTTARETAPGVHAVSGFDMEPISTVAPQSPGP